MGYLCEACGGLVELERTPLESGLVRLAALGAGGFELSFDHPQVHDAAAPLLGPCPHHASPAWDEAALRPVAARGWDALVEASPDDERLAQLEAIWRPRALRLAGRVAELGRDDVLRARLADRLDDIAEAMHAARASGDENEAERLHARYIEIGMVFAGRTAAALEDT
jgi:hypothetical protein